MRIIAICCLTILLSGCRKYLDGPTVSIKTKKTRVVNKWKPENNPTFVANDDTIYSYHFKETGELILETSLASDTNTSYGTWKFDKTKSAIMIHIPEYEYRRNFVFSVDDSLEILRLKEKQLWYRSTYYHKTVRMASYYGE